MLPGGQGWGDGAFGVIKNDRGHSVDMKHSGLGISSFIISAATGVAMFVLIMLAGVLETTTAGGMDEESVAAVLIGLFMFGFLFIDLLAVGLGIAGLFQKDRKKIFAILGVVIAVATILMTLLLLVVGLIS